MNKYIIHYYSLRTSHFPLLGELNPPPPSPPAKFLSATATTILKMQHLKPSSSTTTAALLSNPSSGSTTTTLSPSTFPLNILVMILKRVPVKSVLHLKRASKPWLSCLSSPEFISMHLKETAKDPQNHSFLIHYLNHQNFNLMCLLNINSTDSEPDCFMHPFAFHYLNMDLVGSINGLVCLCCPPAARKVALWNRALKVYHSIWRSEKGLFWGGDVLEKVSLGFAYDSVKDDYKIVRIAVLVSNALSPCPSNAIMAFDILPGALFKTRAEVYSLHLGDWETVELPDSLPFNVSSTRCNVIVNGIPYWIGTIYQGTNQSESTEVLLWYDVTDMSFKHLPMPEIERGMGTGAKLVEWKGNLGMIVYKPKGEIGSYVHVLVYDEKEVCWNKASTYGPIELKMEKIIQCSKDGVVLGETQDGKLFLFDYMTNAVKEFTVPQAKKRSFKALSYSDSMVSSKLFESF